jgi:hypothetical protein
MKSRDYEIWVAGAVPPEALVDFEQLSAGPQQPMTLVRGQLPDQAALNGLLARLELFGVQVYEVHRLRDHTIGG